MISLYDYKTENALPSELRTASRIASCRAYDDQKRKFIARIKRVYIYADLDCVDDDKLDFLAVENRVLFYSSDLDPDVKRSLIRNSIYWYMKLGTSQAMEEMINIVFSDSNTSVEEWYSYAGEAYHFRIVVGTTVTQTSITEFLKYLNTVKNARSRLDYMTFQNGITIYLKAASAYQEVFYTHAGDGTECGTYPDTVVGFQQGAAQIDIEAGGQKAGIDYTHAGTVPDVATGLQLSEVEIDIEGGSQEATIVYPTDSETEAGTYPDQAVGLSGAESGVSVEAAGVGYNFYYNTDADKKSAEEE